MNSRDIINRKKEILTFLSNRRLKDAFEALIKLAATIQDWHISDRLSELETNYKLMLHYLFEGVKDDERENVYHSLLRSLYELTDDLTDELLKTESSNIFYERWRINERQIGTSLLDLQQQLEDIYDSFSLIDLIEDSTEKAIRKRELSVKRERIASDIFNIIFASPRANETQMKTYLCIMDSETIPLREKALLVTALTLNIFHRFDARKVQTLLHLTVSHNSTIRIRSIIGLVTVMQMYDIRWSLYPELQHQLDTLAENAAFRKAVQRTIIQIIQSRETEKISDKITNEILPEMMKFNSLAGRKLNMEELMSGDADFSDKNPEWKKELEESGLASKLQEYTNLQMEGADVFHSTFSSLKSFPFFTDMSNWFLPFDPAYSELSGLFPEGQSSNLLKAAVIDSGHMCDSDKYSFCFSLLQISSNQREMMMGQLGAESEEIKQLQREAKDLNPAADEEVMSNQYIQNLYRFYKLSSFRSSFFDIFKLRLNFFDKKSIAPLISDTESMRKIALYCFDKNKFEEALDIFTRLTNVDSNAKDLWQKIGYCRQMLNNLESALQAYLQADLIAPDNSWIIKRIAQLYRSLKQPQLSLQFYKKAAQLNPDNLGIEMNIGHCYLELKEYEQALNSYFKVEILDQRSNKALRPIAWTAFLLSKFDLSRQYYQQIIANKPTMHDYLNAGHVELCSSNLKEAIDYYKKAALQESGFDQFATALLSDKEVLIANGIDAQLLPYLFDQVKYRLD